MVTPGAKKIRDVLLLLNGFALAVLINQAAAFYFFRLDLTEEKRYSIQKPTRELLEKLDDHVYVEVYLEGELNAGFRRLRKAVRETLEEFRVYSNNKIHFVFTDPAKARGQNAQQEFMTELVAKGIQPVDVIDSKNGQRRQTRVFPGALVSYGGAEAGVMLFKGKTAIRSEEVLNQSVEGLEFELANAIEKLFNPDRKRIGIVTGHGELDSIHLASLHNTLLESYDVFRTNLGPGKSLNEFNALIVAKPTRPFSETEKFMLDQYLLGGGRLLLLLDRMEANMDSASARNYFAQPYDLGLEDPLFHYGLRVNQDVVQDLFSVRLPVVTGMVNGTPQMTPLEWPFFPLINHYADHSMTRNLDATAFRIASSIDSVKAPGIRKTPLLFSSAYSRRVMAPVRISISDLRKDMNAENFTGGPFVLGYLLEGRFSSAFANRFLPEGIDSAGFRKMGIASKLIVIADGDVARNEINTRTNQPQPLGLDRFSGYTFANQELITNMVAYLTNESGLINARSKEVKLRPLDKEKVERGRFMWQTINLVLPVAVITLLGIFKAYFRRRRFAAFPSGHQEK